MCYRLVATDIHSIRNQTYHLFQSQPVALNFDSHHWEVNQLFNYGYVLRFRNEAIQCNYCCRVHVIYSKSNPDWNASKFAKKTLPIFDKDGTDCEHPTIPNFIFLTFKCGQELNFLKITKFGSFSDDLDLWPMALNSLPTWGSITTNVFV